jgi:hypothetical protein
MRSVLRGLKYKVRLALRVLAGCWFHTFLAAAEKIAYLSIPSSLLLYIARMRDLPADSIFYSTALSSRREFEYSAAFTSSRSS